MTTIFEQDIDQETLDYLLTKEAIAVDTETRGLLPARDRLCLVQIADDDGNFYLIKINPDQKEAVNLKALLENTSVLKIFHFARFDIAFLLRQLHINTHNIFCTYVASKLARTYSSSHSLKTLVAEFESIELDKSKQTSDWGDPELSEEQLNYAAGDVEYLHSISAKLAKILERENILPFAFSCFASIRTLAYLDICGYHNLFEH